MKHALKEWAVICQALAEGRQAILLRKGGIAEETGEFRLEHDRFWLYPTYVHQQRTGIRSEAYSLIERVEAERPPSGTIRFSHFAEVSGVYHVHQLADALKLSEFHHWSMETVQARFVYRSPGLFVVPMRVYRAAEIHELPDSATYAGCKSWVELEHDLSTDGATPVMSNERFRETMLELERILQPTAWA